MLLTFLHHYKKTVIPLKDGMRCGDQVGQNVYSCTECGEGKVW